LKVKYQLYIKILVVSIQGSSNMFPS